MHLIVHSKNRELLLLFHLKKTFAFSKSHFYYYETTKLLKINLFGCCPSSKSDSIWGWIKKKRKLFQGYSL